MKKKFFGFLSAILAFGVLGGAAFAIGNDNLQKTDSAKATVETIVYVDLSWGSLSEVKGGFSKDGRTTMSKTSGSDASHGTYIFKGTPSSANPYFYFGFKQDSSQWHPIDSPGTSNKNWSESQYKIGVQLKAGNAYRVYNINYKYGYDNQAHKWFDYKVEDLGEIKTVTPYVVGETIYFKPYSGWLSDNAWISAQFIDESSNSTMIKCETNDNTYFSCVVPDGEWTSLVFGRMNSASQDLTTENRWNCTSKILYEEGKDLWTGNIEEWDDAKGVWSIYTPPEVYTITYVDPLSDETLGTDSIVEGNEWNSKFIEKDGYKLEGWYRDEELTSEYQKKTVVNENLTLYAKYTKADDFEILIGENFFGASGDNLKMYVYMFRDSTDGGNNHSWPGVALEAEAKKFSYFYTFEIDASKSFDTIIFSVYDDNDNTFTDAEKKGQTVNLELSYVDLTAYHVGSKTTSGEYNASHAVDEISLGYNIFKLGGAWEDNDVTTANCSSNYATAKTMYAGLSDSSKNNFQTSTDDSIKLARTRYLAWCSANNDLSPYSGEVVSATKVALNFDNDNSIYLIIVISVVGIAFIGFVILKKKKAIN